MRQTPQPPRRQPTGSRNGRSFSWPNPCARSSATSTRSYEKPNVTPWPSNVIVNFSPAISQPLEQGAFRLLGAIFRGQEAFGENVLFEQASLHQSGDAGFDHRRRTAEIGGVAGEHAPIDTLGDVMDETALAAPVAGIELLRKRWYIAEVRVLPGQSLEFLAAIKIGLRAHAVHESDRLGITLLQKVEDHRARTGDAGAAGQEQQGAAARLPHDEPAVGAVERQFVAELELVVDIARS